MTIDGLTVRTAVEGEVEQIGALLTERGEAAIMARHMGHVAVFRAIVPHGPPLAAIPEFTPLNKVDELALAKWKKLGPKKTGTPAPTASHRL